MVPDESLLPTTGYRVSFNLVIVPDRSTFSLLRIKLSPKIYCKDKVKGLYYWRMHIFVASNKWYTVIILIIGGSMNAALINQTSTNQARWVWMQEA